MSDITENTDLIKKSETFYTTFEPKIMTRFMVHIKDKEGKVVIPVWLIKEITRPKAQWSVKNKRWEFLPITISVYDPIVPSTSQMLYHYMLDEEPKLLDITIDVLGPVADTVEKWEIKDAIISHVDFGHLSWSGYSEEKREKLEQLNVTRYYKGGTAVEITVTLTYDFALLVY